jgi:hypothetical protein
MDDNELPKKILWTNLGGQRGDGRTKSSCIDRIAEDARYWVVDIVGRIPRIEVTGEIS